MKQKDLLQFVQQETGINKALVEQLTVAMTDSIRSLLVNGDSLSIQGFGSFEVRRKEERLSVHPSTGKRFIVPPKIVPVFRPGVTLRNRIKTVKAVNAEGSDGQ